MVIQYGGLNGLSTGGSNNKDGDDVMGMWNGI